MLKLYKRDSGGLMYWETWDKNSRAGIVHWGNVGEKGESKEVSSGLFSNFRKDIQKEINVKIGEGFIEILEESLDRLVIEYKIEGMGTEEDLAKRHLLESKMNEFLGWRGLGHCDGGSIGSGTMEILCFVVDFNVAKKLIEEELKQTEFSDFSKIFKEE
jgi:hypothetical protein